MITTVQNESSDIRDDVTDAPDSSALTREATTATKDKALTKREQDILDIPPEKVTAPQLFMLRRRDPELADRRMKEIQEAALADVRSGNRAARTLDTLNADPQDRAQFLALREELATDWKPRNGIERTLIDTMALSHSMYLLWLERSMLFATLESECSGEQVKKNGTWTTPRVTDVQAIDQAASLADRFHRMFVRSLRALRDQRRYNPTIVVQNVGQVNVGQEQVNVANTGSPAD